MKRVIFHISDMQTWPSAINSVKNALAEIADLKVIVLANGKAVRVVDRPAELQSIKILQKQGVQFEVCAHASQANHISDESIHQAGFTKVAAGSTELINRQLDGYAYIRI